MGCMYRISKCIEAAVQPIASHSAEVPTTQKIVVTHSAQAQITQKVIVTHSAGLPGLKLET